MRSPFATTSSRSPAGAGSRQRHAPAVDNDLDRAERALCEVGDLLVLQAVDLFVPHRANIRIIESALPRKTSTYEVEGRLRGS